MDRQVQIQKAIEIDEVAIDPVPVQLILGTSLYKVHTLFSLLSLNHAYVTYQGQLVGVVGLKEVSRSLICTLENEGEYKGMIINLYTQKYKFRQKDRSQEYLISRQLIILTLIKHNISR